MAINVTVSYPDGSGGTTTSSTNPSAGGAFAFSNIPVGVRTVTAVYRATGDTVTTYSALLPQVGATIAMRLPEAPFAGTGGGGGGGTGGIEFVFGSASSPSDDIQFSVWNAGTSAITVSTITANYITTSYYRYVRWGGTVVFNSANPRAASGEVVNFSSSQSINPGQAVVIRLEDFTNSQNGSGGSTSFANVVFTIQFSDGSSMAFNSN